MFYYLVWVRSNRYHGQEPLTYAYAKRLPTGAIVEVELQRNLVVGFISELTTKPRFKTKELARVVNLPTLPPHLIQLIKWLKSYYPAPIGTLAQQLLPASLSDKQVSQLPSQTLDEPSLAGLPPLTSDQRSALEAMSSAQTFLLHGKTGSGKTRVYIELALKSIAANKSVLVLTPEISLTTQLANSLRAVFGNRVVVMHSRQTPAERRNAWVDCLYAKEPLVVVGPRSALFAPLQKLGLIVLDESHENAYKQTQSPQYQTSRVAAYLAKLTNSYLILGSATPLVVDYYLAEQKNRTIIRLDHLAQTSKYPNTRFTVVDRRDQSLFNRSPYLSQPLIQVIESALASSQQTLLYLNRRGTARMILCQNCGWQALCPNCDVALTYHGDKHLLFCHSCNYHTSVPATCPSCGHSDVVFKTAGTKAIVEEVTRLFPQANVARFDTDNLKSESFEQNYQDAYDGNIDILVGTQLLAKGLDLPKLSTVGILLADTSLYLPDFSAQERTFQLINQVLGRIGRGHNAGQAIIQTYNPSHPVLGFAINDDFKQFYRAELAARKQFMFPPYCYLLKLTVRRASSKSAEDAAQKLKQQLETRGLVVKVEGPAPSFYERLQGKFQWQLVVKALNRSELLKIIDVLPSGWSQDIDPIDLL